MKLLQFSIPPLILGLAVGAYIYMSNNKPVAEMQEQPPNPTIEVKVTSIQNSSYQPTLTAQGIVRAKKKTVLAAEVAGKVLRLDANFVTGKQVTHGQTLVYLDAARYSAAVAIAKAEVTRAEAAVIEEQARVALALDNWKRSGNSGKPGALTLREPQLKAARASLAIARINLTTAQLDLAATRIVAPYDGVIANTSAHPGQLVNSSTSFGTIVATDLLEARVSLSGNKLELLPAIPFAVELSIRQKLHEYTYKGVVVSREVEVNENTRQLGIIVEIPNPFAYPQPLLPGQFVSVRMPGKPIEDVARIPLTAISTSGMVNLVEDGKLARAKVALLFAENDTAIIRGLADGQLVTISGIHSLPVGTRLTPVHTP